MLIRCTVPRSTITTSSLPSRYLAFLAFLPLPEVFVHLLCFCHLCDLRNQFLSVSI